MSTANLRTGDIKKFSNDSFFAFDNWAVVFNDNKKLSAFGVPTRASARSEKSNGERIAKILSRTKKTVTVEITK